MNAREKASVERQAAAHVAWDKRTFGPYYTDDNALVAEDGDQETVATLWDASVKARTVKGERIPARFLVLVLYGDGEFEIVPAPAIVCARLPRRALPTERPHRDMNAAERALSVAIGTAWVAANQ